MAYKIETPEKMKYLVDEYFKIMDEDGKPYTKSGLTAHLGISATCRKEYEKRDEFKDILELAYMKIDANTTEMSLTGKYNPIFGKFILKSQFGYTEENNVNIGNKDGEPFKVESYEALLSMISKDDNTGDDLDE